jgi:O-antigen/teichoic acid export membrane protein
LLNLALNWLLIPRMGLQAAALATLVSYIFSTVLTARPSFQLLPLRIPARAPLKYAAAGVVAWVLTIPIETGSAFWNLAAKCLVAIAAYTGVLYALDTRVRSWFGSLLSAHTPALVASASE